MSHIVRHHRQLFIMDFLPSSTIFIIFTSLYYLLSCHLLSTVEAQIGSPKPGLCPLASKVQPSSHDAARVCQLDDDCPREFKCCATSASIFGDAKDRVCIMPLPSKTACEHQRDAADNIARSAGPTALNFRPECVPGSGTFAPIQCSSVMDRCWCVDAVGFEVPGTRVAYGRPLNCTSPRLCPNPECRMFCAHGFKLDERNGCPLCQCRNPCEEVRCPRSSQCILEEVNCISDPCPPVTQCMARSLDLQCPFGPALADKPADGSSTTTTFICSNKPNIIGRACPLNTHDCVVDDGKDYGICCPRNGTKIEEETTIVVQPVIPATGNNDVGACLLQRGYMIDRALQQFAPKCDAKTGNFAPVQCDYNDEHCYCVDIVSGEEIIGTRRRNGLQPNCAAPVKCVLPTCDPNLKCEHGFEFDADGCPLCRCYDPCSESECPSDLCHAVSVDCMRPPCPIVASCKEARSLSNPCHIGRPLTDVQSGDFHVCGQFAQAQPCPEQYSCEIIDAEGHGLCCLSPPPPPSLSLPSNVPSRTAQRPPTVISQDSITEPLRIAATVAVGQCPVSSSTSSNQTEKCNESASSHLLRCKTDAECNQNEKCCDRLCESSSGVQHELICRPAATKTQCQQQQESVDDAQRLASYRPQGGVLGNFRPQCLESNGAYARVQCNTSWCWCVNDAGIELPITRIQRDRVGELNCSSSGSISGGADSLEARLECGLQCRMFCPHGFVLNPQSGCPECECRSPCDDLKCPIGHECQLRDIECSTTPCRAIAKCFPTVQPNPCIGNTAALRDPVSNATVRCDVRETSIRGAVPTCPLNYECRHAPLQPTVSDGQNATGVCCQRQSEDICTQPADVGVCSESLARWHFNYQTRECEPFLWGGCGGNLNNFKTLDMCQIVCKDSSGANKLNPTTESSTAVGHCPVPQLVDGNSCRKECAADEDCPGTNTKCCSNGCGTRCIEAEQRTACQQLRIAATRMQRNLIPNIAQFASSHFVPRCMANGEFERVQCDAANKWCWCVNPQGMEMDGSRQLKSDRIACEVGRAINPVNVCALDQQGPQCRLLCPFGFKRNETNGCPMCECIEPCESFQCPAHTYCDIIGVDCTNPPCPAVPTCVPQPIRSVAACAGGDEPLRQVGSDAFATCQDDVECPSTHSCTFAPTTTTTTTTTAATTTKSISANVSMETTGVCCKKTKDVCSLPMVVGSCRAALTRFYFDHTVKQCKQFTYGGCQGNANNFLNADECSMVCLPLVPPLTTIAPATTTSPSPIPTIARSSLTTTDSSMIVLPSARDAIASTTNGQCPNGDAPVQPFTDGPQDDPSNFCDDHTISCPLTHTCSHNNNASFICCPKNAAVDCQQPPEPGMCRGGFPRWFFSQKTLQCEMFLYGGCDGNSNNFANKDQCQQVCAVLSPVNSGVGGLGASCATKRQSALEKHSPEDSLLVYAPQCDNKNSALYSSMQCIDTVGLCWCVNQTSGVKISAAQQGGNETSCIELQESLSMARTGRVLAPMDLVDNSEQIIDICSSNSNSNEVHPTTSAVQKTVRLHECDPSLCKHKVCLGFPQAQCRINPCSTGHGEPICTTEFFVGDQKVNCSQTLTVCESELQRVVNSDLWQSMRQPLPQRRVKQLSSSLANGFNFNSGQCPPFFTLRLNNDIGQCQQQCRVDSDCTSSDQKCCFNGCGTQCTAVMDSPPTPTTAVNIVMPLYIPQCSPIDGNYEPTQCAGDMCWCVTDRESGHANLNSTTRGNSLNCSAKQQLARFTAPTLTCGSSSFELCTSECLTATCPTHTEALCVADPCRHCQVKFVNAAGEEVDCRSPCEQPLTTNNNKCLENPGTSVVRFYYNSAAQQCKAFNSTSCGGSGDNSFATLGDCQHECIAFDPCDQPKAVGICRASIPRWFYNKQSRQCEQFTYGGCRGNMNNFQTEAECETICPARVICPRVRIAIDQQNSTVVRTTACNRRTTCADAQHCAHPLAICDVEVCSSTCAPIFKDIWGRRVQCDTRPHKCAVEYMERMVMADVYHPQCTAGGDAYTPTQCQQDHFNEKCWCVDEAGEPITDKNGERTYFKRDEKVCLPVPINTTIVRLRFDNNRVDAVTVLNLLRQELAQLLTPEEQSESGPLKISVKVPSENSTSENNNLIELRLQGASGVDVAYFLAKRNELRNSRNNPFIVNNTNVVTSIVVEHERVATPAVAVPVTNDIEDSAAKNTGENIVNISKPTTRIENDAVASLNEIDSERRNANNSVGQHNPSTSAWKYVLPIVLFLALAILSLLVIGGLLYRRKHCGSYGTRRVAAARAAAANAAAIAEATNAADVPPRNPNFLQQAFATPSTVIVSPLNAAPPSNVASSTTHRITTMTTTANNPASNYLSLFTHAEGDDDASPHHPPNTTYDSSPETGRRTYASSLTNSTTSSSEHNNGTKSRLHRQQTPYARNV